MRQEGASAYHAVSGRLVHAGATAPSVVVQGPAAVPCLRACLNGCRPLSMGLVVAASAIFLARYFSWARGPSAGITPASTIQHAAPTIPLLQVHVGLYFGTTMNALVSDHRRGNPARVPYKLVISKLAPGKRAAVCASATVAPPS